MRRAVARQRPVDGREIGAKFRRVQVWGRLPYGVPRRLNLVERPSRRCHPGVDARDGATVRFVLPVWRTIRRAICQYSQLVGNTNQPGIERKLPAEEVELV